MKVIFLQNIKGVGQIGDVKEVSDGYGRNYLIPQKLAKQATSVSLKEAELLKKKLAQTLELEHAQAAEIGKRIKDTVLELTEKASASGTLFAAVGRKEIIQKLKEVSGYEVGEDTVHIPEHALKTTGEHAVELRLASELTVPLIIRIRGELSHTQK